MCCAMPNPWFGPRLNVFRISMSRVPGRKSASVLVGFLSPIGYRYHRLSIRVCAWRSSGVKKEVSHSEYPCRVFRYEREKTAEGGEPAGGWHRLRRRSGSELHAASQAGGGGAPCHPGRDDAG